MRFHPGLRPFAVRVFFPALGRVKWKGGFSLNLRNPRHKEREPRGKRIISQIFGITVIVLSVSFCTFVSHSVCVCCVLCAVSLWLSSVHIMHTHAYIILICREICALSAHDHARNGTRPHPPSVRSRVCKYFMLPRVFSAYAQTHTHTQ